MRLSRRIRASRERAHSYSIAVSLVAILVSFASLIFTMWSFWYHELRVKNEVVFSLVQYECYPRGQDGSMAVKAFVANEGTTPVAIIRTDWLLSDAGAGMQNDRRHVREVHEFTPPVVVEGGAIRMLDYRFLCREDSCKDRIGAAAHFYEGLPDYIVTHPNIHIVLRNTFVVYCIDGRGDLRETRIALGDFSFSGTGGFSEHPYGAALTNMPLRADLLQGELVSDKFRSYRVWRPAMYSITNSEKVAPSALRALTPEAEVAVSRYLQSIGNDLAPEYGHKTDGESSTGR